jgi:hypothetical protein
VAMPVEPRRRKAPTCRMLHATPSSTHCSCVHRCVICCELTHRQPTMQETSSACRGGVEEAVTRTAVAPPRIARLPQRLNEHASWRTCALTSSSQHRQRRPQVLDGEARGGQHLPPPGSCRHRPGQTSRMENLGDYTARNATEMGVATIHQRRLERKPHYVSMQDRQL